MLSNGVKILYNHVTILLLLLYTYIPLGLIHLFPGYCWTRAVPYTHSKLLSWRTRSDPWWVSIPEARKITFFPPLYFSFSVLLSIISQRYMLIYEFPSPCFSLKHDISFKSLSFFFSTHRHSFVFCKPHMRFLSPLFVSKSITPWMAVYDVSRRESFDHITMWMQEVDVYSTNKLVKMLVGNKIDLVCGWTVIALFFFPLPHSDLLFPHPNISLPKDWCFFISILLYIYIYSRVLVSIFASLTLTPYTHTPSPSLSFSLPYMYVCIYVCIYIYIYTTQPRAVDMAEGQQFAEKHGMLFIECRWRPHAYLCESLLLIPQLFSFSCVDYWHGFLSAKTCKGVKQAFEELTQKVSKHK